MFFSLDATQFKKRYVFLAAIVLCVVVYKLAYPTFWWNQRLTLTISTPDGDKTGSAVISTTVNFTPTLGFPGGVTSKIFGEATVVELSEGKYIFALLNNPISLAKNTFKYLVLTEKEVKSGKQYNRKYQYFKFWWVRDIMPVKPKSNYPTLITFDDINDPATVKLIDPNDLAATFGKGFALKEMTLEITDKNVEFGKIQSVFSYFWWPIQKRRAYYCAKYKCKRSLSKIVFANNTSNYIKKSNFIKE